MKNYTPFRRQLGRLLAAQRIQRQLTQKEMAAKLYIDRSAVSKMEHGDYNMPLFRVMDYCVEVGVSLSELIKGVENISSGKKVNNYLPGNILSYCPKIPLKSATSTILILRQKNPSLSGRSRLRDMAK